MARCSNRPMTRASSDPPVTWDNARRSLHWGPAKVETSSMRQESGTGGSGRQPTWGFRMNHRRPWQSRPWWPRRERGARPRRSPTRAARSGEGSIQACAARSGAVQTISHAASHAKVDVESARPRRRPTMSAVSRPQGRTGSARATISWRGMTRRAPGRAGRSRMGRRGRCELRAVARPAGR